jgi:eukaryotic-like serine/threonine-protein kinase
MHSATFSASTKSTWCCEGKGAAPGRSKVALRVDGDSRGRMSGEIDPATTAIEDTLALEPKAASSETPVSETTQRIGGYRLVQLIGEGGMGEVWLAEQLEPVRRKVAIKVIKAGMDTKQVVARFESERQALALMDHPAIAKVFDGGSTPEGRPYFVMEYVAGVPITDHCDSHRLSTEDRLELLTEVCEGIQHAHQKAIIHRDLKPSNILVSLVDGKAQPKIIDFGIAKATGYRLTEKTLFTEVGSVIGTPEYMSPEQADLTGQDVDTRTDVYSLGVILYQLLTGELPFGSKELRSSSYEELRRKLKEVEPPKPSTRFGTLGDAATGAAKNRGTDPGTLKRQLQGDLDAITMKALEKERARRYGTPLELAADIGRHLRDEPVLAQPPGRGYRLRKYVRRHRAGVAVGTGLMLLLLAFAATMGLQARRIARERDRANTERDRATREEVRSRRVTEFVTGMFSAATFGEGQEKSIRARAVLDNASKEIDADLNEDPELQAELLETVAAGYNSLELYPQARASYARVVDIRRRVLGPQHPATLRPLSALALAVFRTGNRPEGYRLASEALAAQSRVLAKNHPDTQQTEWVIESILRNEEDEYMRREELALRRRTLGPEHPETLNAMTGLARTLAAEGRLAEAEKMQREVLESQRRVLGLESTVTLSSISALVETLSAEGSLTEAEKFQRESVEIQRRMYSPGSQEVANANYYLACLLARQRKREEALSLLSVTLSHLDTNTALGISQNPDLSPIRADPRFDALVAEVKKRLDALR